MKKIFLSLVCILTALICVTGCNNKLKTYEEVNYNKLMEMLDKKESFALFVGSSECSHCATYKVTLEKFISEYQVKVYYINILDLSTDEYNHFISLINFGGSTPTTVFITDGEEKTIYNRIIGSVDYSKVVSKFKSAGYID